MPGMGTLQYLNETAHSKPIAGQIKLVFVWGQYHKPGYKYVPFYTALQAKYGDKVKCVGVSVDPDAGYPTKFIEDPGKKYSSVFPCDFAMAWDNGTVKKGLMTVGNFATMSPPHAFLVNASNKIVWHQDHSELGATAPSYMELMEDQVDLLLAGEALKVVGTRPVQEYEDDEEDEEECAIEIDGDDDDPFSFL